MLSFQLLGQVGLSKNGIPLSQFRSQKELALLLYLAHTGEAHQRDFLAELLWESSSTKQSLTNLRTVLARLRKKVDDALHITRRTVTLTPTNQQQVDSVHLLKTLAEISQIDTAAQASALQKSLETYKGDFLADFHLSNAPQFDEWVIITREHIRRQVISGYQRLGTYFLSTGDIENGISAARRWIEVDELDEMAHTLLIQLLLKAGRKREAIAHYEYCRKLLQTGLGIQPPAQMMALIENARPQPVVVTRPPTAVEHNLPVAYDQFFGRKKVIEEIHLRFDQPWCRLVTIMGQGGMGKTRLATTIARSRLRQYPDGVWLIELANLDADDENLAEAIAVEIATILGLRLTGATTPAEQLLNHLQHKQMMLVLDNFEHLLNDGVQIVLDIVQQCERVQLLVTSREALKIRAEWTISLTGLNYPANELDEMHSDAVELFVARWAQQQHGVIADANLTAIRAICRMVEGLPLAIELAAALTHQTTPQMIVEQLQGGFDALTTSLRDVPDRHRGLHTVFEMSWRTLSTEVQERLARLAQFRGGFTQTAAQEIADATAQHLATLVGKSLLRYHLELERYTLHPIIRTYAAAKRPSADQTPRKHCHYFLKLLAEHREPLQKKRPQDSMHILEPDIENIRLAWQTGLTMGETALLYKALEALSIYYQLRGLAHEGASVMRRTFQQSAAWGAESAGLAARAGLERARFQNRLGQARLAIQTIQTTLEAAAQCDDHWAEAMALVWWGESLWRLGEYQTAEKKLKTALRKAHTLDNQEIAGWSHHQLGIINDIQSRYDAALDHFEKARTVWETLENAQNLSNSLNSIGVVNLNKGDLQAAQQAMEQALVLCETIGNQHVQGALLNNLSMIAIDRGDHAGAQYYLNLGLKVAKLTGNLTGQIDIHLNVGINYQLKGQLGLAEKSIKKAIEIAESIGNRSKATLAKLNLAIVKQEQNDLEQAEFFYKQVLEIAQKDNLQSVECEALLRMAELLSKKDIQRAKQSSAQAVTVAAAIKNPTLLERAHTIDEQLRTYVDSQ